VCNFSASSPYYDQCEFSTIHKFALAHHSAKRAQNHEWACISVVLQARIADALGPYPQGVHVDKLSKAVNIEKGKLARILRLLATRNCFLEGKVMFAVPKIYLTQRHVVERDVFANNRLSLILQSSSPVADLAYLHLGIVSKANAILYQNFTTQPYADSYELSKSPFMHAVESEGIEGGYFQWLNAHVRDINQILLTLMPDSSKRSQRYIQ
jgi:hypothetical protein